MTPIAPSSDKYERACLITALIDSENAYRILDLNEDDFYYDINREIFRAIKIIIDDERKVDILSVHEILKDKDVYIKAGGDIALAKLYRGYARTTDYNTYLDKVKQFSRRRKLIQTYKKAAEEVVTAYDIDDIIAEVELITAESPQELGENITEKSLEWIVSVGNSVKTGFLDVDTKIGGLYEDELILLAARPSMGKSALALHLAMNVAREKPVLFFSLEMSLKQLSQRIMANITQIDGYKFRRNKLTDHETLTAQAVFDKYKTEIGDNLRIIDNIYNLNKIINTCKKHPKTGLIIIDYLQLVKVSTKEQRYLAIGEISRAFKRLAKTMHCPVVGLSQMSRAVETRVDKVPQLSDLRESGDLEQDADVVVFLHGEKENDLRTLIFAKNRQGPLGKIDLWFRQNRMLFQDREVL